MSPDAPEHRDRAGHPRAAILPANQASHRPAYGVTQAAASLSRSCGGLVFPRFRGVALLDAHATVVTFSNCIGVSMPRLLWRRCRLWKISRGTVASGDHRPRRPPPEPLNVASDRGIDHFEHFLQLFGRGSAFTLLLAGDALRSDATVPVDPRLGHLTSQHRDLVAQHEQFGVLGRCTSREQCKPPHHLAEHQIEQSQGHAPFIAARGLLRRTRSSAPTTDFLAPHTTSSSAAGADAVQ